VSLEDMQIERVKTIALMAAILQAGDRACSEVGHEDVAKIESPTHYVREAQALYSTADALEAEGSTP